MAWMNNSIYNYNKIDDGEHVYSDYTEFDLQKIALLPELEENADYIDYYYLKDGDRLEYISYALYGSTQYWDLILAINAKDPIHDMSYDFDVMSDTIDDFIKGYTDVYTGGIFPDIHMIYFRAIFEIEIRSKNESDRKLKVIKPSRLGEFMRMLRTSGLILV